MKPVSGYLLSAFLRRLCPNFTSHGVLRVSVVKWFRRLYHHGGTENTDNALNNLKLGDYSSGTLIHTVFFNRALTFG